MNLDRNSKHFASQVLSLQDTRIFIVGDLILDAYIAGKVSRISQEAPVPIVLETSRESVLGGAANVAANVASFGAKAFLCGRIGDDVNGTILISLCEQMSINSEGIFKSNSCPTTVKTRVMAGYQQLLRIDSETTESIHAAEEQYVLDNFSLFAELEGNKALVLSDYGKGVLTISLLKKIIQASLETNIQVVTDPKSLDLSRYSGTTIIKPNLSEGRALLKSRNPAFHATDLTSEINAIGDLFLEASLAKNICMSLSEHGLFVKGSDDPEGHRISSTVIEVADVSGAGDTVVAFLAMGLAAKLPILRVADFGNVAAGIVCGKLGTATLTSGEFLTAFDERIHAVSPEKSVSRSEIKIFSEQFRKQNRKVVFTNGCFDIIHAGHVHFLQKAKSFGDILIVGLNSDDSVRRLKGETRPILTCSDRASVLSAFSCVDFVVEFDEDLPLELIKVVRPDILVKGEDYPDIDAISGGREVISWGGAVHRISLLEGKSTTKIVERASMPPRR